MSDINFERDGQVGDEVHHPSYGNGHICSIRTGSFPITVCFEDGSYHTFLSDGREWPDSEPTLCWGHRGPLDQGQPPERGLKPLALKRVPVWAYVSDFPDGWKNRTRRRVIAKNPDVFYAVANGNDEYDADAIAHWRYAWECNE